MQCTYLLHRQNHYAYNNQNAAVDTTYQLTADDFLSVQKFPLKLRISMSGKCSWITLRACSQPCKQHTNHTHSNRPVNMQLYARVNMHLHALFIHMWSYSGWYIPNLSWLFCSYTEVFLTGQFKVSRPGIAIIWWLAGLPSLWLSIIASPVKRWNNLQPAIRSHLADLSS